MKLKARLWISFIVALGLLFFALARLPVYGSSIEFGFSIIWLSFCMLVIGANFYGILRLGRGEKNQPSCFNCRTKRGDPPSKPLQA